MLMTYAEFQEQYEREADAEGRAYDALPLSRLVTDIRAGHLGQYYQIWYSLARRARPREVNDLLLAFLSSDADYLHRYHCAAALIRLNGLAGWEPQHLSATRTFPVAQNLHSVRNHLRVADDATGQTPTA